MDYRQDDLQAQEMYGRALELDPWNIPDDVPDHDEDEGAEASS